RYFSEPATLDRDAKEFLHTGLVLAMEWAAQGLVVPHVGRTIDSNVEAINAGLQSLRAGGGSLGKVSVIVDRELAGGGDGRQARPSDRAGSLDDRLRRRVLSGQVTQRRHHCARNQG